LKFTNKWLAIFYRLNLTSASYLHITYCPAKQEHCT